MKKMNLLGVMLLASTTIIGAGNVFAVDTTPVPATASTPVTVELQPKDVSGDKPVVPTPDPSDSDNPGGGDKPTDITGAFGIAYAPKGLKNADAKVELGNTPNQMVKLGTVKDDGSIDTTVKNLNVGVRDATSKSGRTWTLSAQLQWTGATLEGASIEATGNGQVTENNKGTLVATSKIENDVTTGNLSIGTGSQTDIMSAKSDKVMSGTYNYQFAMPKLKIADPSNVEAKTYTGNIVWNLSNAI